MATTEAAPLDGRRLRRTQNREAVLDALLSLFEEGEYAPSTNEVAERAGISPRSLFRYFDDVDDLHRAVVERELAAVRHLLELPVTPNAPTEEKVRAVVETRLRLHEISAPAARAARLAAHRSPVVAGQIRDARTLLREQVVTLFEHDLPVSRRAVLPAIDALLSFETHDLMRVAHGMSRAETAASLTVSITRLLAA
jgi:AcrR family transcriptional regulator